jgi:hypothetical protein
LLRSYDDPVICTYDVNLLSAPVATDILPTHPMVIIGGILVGNNFFTRSDDFIRELKIANRANPALQTVSRRTSKSPSASPISTGILATLPFLIIVNDS